MASALAGIRAFDGGVRLIAGGRPKQESFEPLAPAGRERCVACYLIGEAAERMAASWRRRPRPASRSRTSARWSGPSRPQPRDAKPGEVVLLSPACASFDAFKDFEERGDRFRELVEALP